MIFKRVFIFRRFSTKAQTVVNISGENFLPDSFTNVTPKILSHVGKNLHIQKYHPLSFVREKIVRYFKETFKSRTGNPIFSVYDNLSPVVTIDQNFDSLQVPKDHVSRNKNDCYYINADKLLRSHMTAYQKDFLKMGFNHFLMVGDVYRRDEIDQTHYPVFHQLDAVCISTPEELFMKEDYGRSLLPIFEKDPLKQVITSEKQSVYTLEASKKTELKLKQTLEGLTKYLFGENIEYKWTESVFPFTHPSWELEILLNGKWLEVLGCGVMKHEILKLAGCENHIGWAFGVGIERLAMTLYNIPDIRVFWSNDTGFTHQFDNKTCHDKITFKPISIFPQCSNDISFWLPDSEYCSNDFYEVAREIGGEMIEQIKLVDEFKKGDRVSHCYRICYRSMERTLTQTEVNNIHKMIEQEATNRLKIVIR